MPTPESVEFGRRLRAARQYGYKTDPTREVTQDELAQALGGYNRATVRSWENGEVPKKRADQLGIAAVVSELTGLPPEFFEVDFSELRRAMESDPTLSLDWTPEQEIQSGGERLGD